MIKRSTELINLKYLKIDYNQIVDISALSGLTNLQELHLSYNQISDISPLPSLTNLTKLNLQANPLSPTALNVHIPQLKERGVDVLW